MEIWSFIYNVLAFPGTLTVVTFLAAFVVWMLYDKQRRDQRRDAAKIVLSEIEHAEELIPDLKKALKVLEDGGEPESMRLLTIDNWHTAQYLLTGKLPDDVIETINNFYAYSRLIDEALAFVDGIFTKNEAAVRENAFRVNANYTVNALEDLQSNPKNDPKIEEANNKIVADIKERRDAFNQTFPTLYSYRPVKPKDDIKKYIELLPTGLGQGRTGEKLRLAKLGLIKRILAGQWIQP